MAGFHGSEGFDREPGAACSCPGRIELELNSELLAAELAVHSEKEESG